MPSQRLQDLSEETLRKRAKFASFLIGLLIAVIVIYASLYIVFLFTGDKTIDFSRFIILVAMCFILLIPISSGLKKIKAELAARDTQRGEKTDNI